MKSTTRLLAIAAAMVLCSCGKIGDRLKESVVLVKTNGGHGTAFFVEGKSEFCTLVTAAHVLRDKQQVSLQTGDGKERSPKIIHLFEGGLDLAVMTFEPQGARCGYRALELGHSDTVKELDTIYISGFPGRGGEPVRQTIETKVTGFGQLPEGYGISYTGELHGGMSGAPVVNDSGKVIAVHGASDRRLIELYDAKRQAKLRPQELAIVRQAEKRAQSGVLVNTFKWGIPINLYIRHRPAIAVSDLEEANTKLQEQVEALEKKLKEEKAVTITLQEEAKVLKGELTVLKTQLEATIKAQQEEMKSLKNKEGRKLQELLVDKKFKEADKLTWEIVLQVLASKEDRTWLDNKDIDNFSCEDWRIIDQLWVKHSDGRFGFSVQKQIYREVGGTTNYDQKIWEAFLDRIGWRQEGKLLIYSGLTFSTTAPPGHLPGLFGWGGGQTREVGGFLSGGKFPWWWLLLSRTKLESCNL